MQHPTIMLRCNSAARPTVKTVESRRGAVAWGSDREPALRFLSPLIKPDVPVSGIRLSDWFHGRPTAGHSTASNEAHETHAVDGSVREPLGSAPCHSMSTREEVAYPFVDVAIDSAEDRPPRPVAEVVRPTPH